MEDPKVITVRMPVALFDALHAEAKNRRLSLNALCVHVLKTEIEAVTESSESGQATS